MKGKVRELIFYACKRIPSMVESTQYSWGEVNELLKKKNITLQNDDTLEIGVENEYNDGDSERDAHYYIVVHRWRDQTKEEKEKFKKDLEELKRKNRESRYEQYLKLKEEFEPKT